MNYELTSRVAQLKENYLSVKPSIAINRAVAYTKVAQENPDLPVAVLRGKSFKRACETAPMLIQTGELIVGNPCGAPRCGSFSPDTAWQWLEAELDEISTRPQDPYFISDADKKTMREELFPFWAGKSLAEKCEEAFREVDLWEFGGEACISDLTYHMTSGGGDSSPGYDIILFEKGILGVLAEAKTKLAELENLKSENSQDVEKSEIISKINYYKGAIETCEGIIIYADRLANYAMALANAETDEIRKAELLEIARVNKQVPANPPKTFQEALQSIWTIQSLFLLEENQCSTSLGRMDQYVLPMFEADMKSGNISEEQAFELMTCFILKCSEMIWYTPGGTSKYFAGYMPFVNMCVGGQKREGGDGTNQLTYVIMHAVSKAKMYQPSLACRVHNQSPKEYLDKITEVMQAGLGMPAIHFDDAHIKMMLKKGCSFEDARDYSLMGCVEPQKSGRIHQWTAGGFTQWPIVIDMALNNGVLNTYGEKQWLETGDVAEFDTYEKFEAAVLKTLDFLIENNCKGTTLVQEVFRDTTPSNYMSLFIDGCMESGKDVTAGGACLYAGPGTIFAGMATYADSMAAVKKVVYDDKKFTLAELKTALDANFEGYPEILKACKEAPKYGNNDDYADLIARDLVDYTEQRMNAQKSLFAYQIHGTLSQSFNTPLGEMVGATPNGRLAYEPLSDGISPSHNADVNGPTAIINSVAKINVEAMSLGQAHNFKVGGNFLNNAAGKGAVKALVSTSSVMGNAQMQFNCVDQEELLDAQTNPENHRDLIVRVAGYSAFFVELCKEVQDEIINRTVLG